MDQADLKPVEGKCVWRGPDVAARAEDWTYQLNASDIEEIDAAVRDIERQNLGVLEITQDRFPGLSKTLQHIRDNLQNGLGFAVIRGIPVARYDTRQAAIAYFDIGAHFGEAVSQNARGHALGHICNLGFDPSLPTARGYQSANKLNFHTDPTDLVGLMCLPPFDEEPAPHFALLKKIAERHGLEKLSMGMTADYETAIAFGATHIRVGSAIFGSRAV